MVSFCRRVRLTGAVSLLRPRRGYGLRLAPLHTEALSVGVSSFIDLDRDTRARTPKRRSPPNRATRGGHRASFGCPVPSPEHMVNLSRVAPPNAPRTDIGRAARCRCAHSQGCPFCPLRRPPRRREARCSCCSIKRVTAAQRDRCLTGFFLDLTGNHTPRDHRGTRAHARPEPCRSRLTAARRTTSRRSARTASPDRTPRRRGPRSRRRRSS